MNSQSPELASTQSGICCESNEAFLKRVLVAEDDPVYRRVVERILTRRGYNVQCVEDGDEALRQASAPGAPRLLVLDWRMPGMCGPDICQKLRQRPASGYQYILMLSANDKKPDVVAGLEAGADDYLTKPFDSHELLARIRVGLRIVTLQQNLFAAQERMRFQATHDSLTGIWNRAALLELLRGELERSYRGQNSLTVLMIDIDHFKHVNDDLGHHVGDVVLSEVARRLAAAVRVYDVIGRYGGEEFVVVAELEPSRVRNYGERLCSSVANSSIEACGKTLTVTVSVGAMIAPPGENWEVAEIIQLADLAMYNAKHNGRNRLEIAIQ